MSHGELTWLGQTVSTERVYWVHDGVGTRVGRPDDGDVQIVGYQDTVTTTGTVLGAHPDLGPVAYSQDRVVTSVTIVEERPMVVADSA